MKLKDLNWELINEDNSNYYYSVEGNDSYNLKIKKTEVNKYFIPHNKLSVSDALIHARKEIKMSQQVLANLAGCDQATISLIESDIKHLDRIRLKTLLKICDALKISIKDIL